MKVSVSDTKGQITEFAGIAESGEEVVLTRHGHPAVRLAPIHAETDSTSCRALLGAMRVSGEANATTGPGGKQKVRNWGRTPYRFRRPALFTCF